MKTSSFIKKPVYSALVFFGTLGVLSAGYAGFVTLQSSDAESGKSLTSTMMQAVIGNLADLDSRVSTMSGAISSLQASAGGIWGTLGGNMYYTVGNVGIGTSSPSQTLHVSASNTAAQLVLERTWSGAGKMAIGADNTGFNVFDTATYTRRLTVTDTGNVGIGTTAPTYKLDVNGSIRGTKIYGNVYVGNSTTPSGQIVFARSELPYSYVGTLCPSPSRPIYVAQSQLGKTGSQLCALDSATDGVKTTCNSTKYIALRMNGTYFAYPTADGNCSANQDYAWPWASEGVTNSRPDEWIHMTKVVCCQ